jgi:hypothetical protein
MNRFVQKVVNEGRDYLKRRVRMNFGMGCLVLDVPTSDALIDRAEMARDVMVRTFLEDVCDTKEKWLGATQITLDVQWRDVQDLFRDWDKYAPAWCTQCLQQIRSLEIGDLAFETYTVEHYRGPFRCWPSIYFTGPDTRSFYKHTASSTDSFATLNVADGNSMWMQSQMLTLCGIDVMWMFMGQPFNILLKFSDLKHRHRFFNTIRRPTLSSLCACRTATLLERDALPTVLCGELVNDVLKFKSKAT